MKLLHMGKVINVQRYMLRFHTFQSTIGDMMSLPEGSIACSSEVRHPREKEKGHKQCTGERERASSQVRLRLVTIWIQENDKDHENNMGRGEMPAILINNCLLSYPGQFKKCMGVDTGWCTCVPQMCVRILKLHKHV